jgi:hypothetical protein
MIGAIHASRGLHGLVVQFEMRGTAAKAGIPLCSDALPLYHRANTAGIQRPIEQGRISCVAR